MSTSNSVLQTSAPGASPAAPVRCGLDKRICLLFTGAMALALAVVSCGGDEGNAGSATSSATAAGSPSPVSSGNAVVEALQKHAAPPELVDGSALGKKDSRVTLAVFEDFQCPYCLRYTSLFEPLIVDDYVKTGKVRLEFHQLPILGEESLQAAVASWCAGQQNQFWTYHKKLFMVEAEAGQLTVEKIGVGRFSATNLKSFAAELGIDTAGFDACFSSDSAVEAVRADVRTAQSLGLRGTPSFVLNGTPLAAAAPATTAAWRKLLDDALAGR